MAFWGKYGHLDTIQAAQQSLLEIAANVKPEQLNMAHDSNFTIDKQYESMRLLRMIEGLQQVIYMNGGEIPTTWIPVLLSEKIKKKYAT